LALRRPSSAFPFAEDLPFLLIEALRFCLSGLCDFACQGFAILFVRFDFKPLNFCAPRFILTQQGFTPSFASENDASPFCIRLPAALLRAAYLRAHSHCLLPESIKLTC
jgi:hypothetical protein